MRRAALALGLGLALGPTAAHANPIDAFGFGARGPAMAGAQTASAIDGGANYYNPALLAWFDDVRIDLGYQLARPSLTLDGADLDVDDSRGLTASLSSPGRVGPVHLAVGAAVFLPDHHLTRVRHIEAGQPRFVLFDNRPHRLFIAASVAARIGERVAVGVGLGYMADTSGGVLLDGRLGFPDAEDSDLDLAIDVDLPPIEYPQAGVAVRATDWLTLGASYRAGFDLDVDLAIALEGDIGASGRDPIVEDGSLYVQSLAKDLFQPVQWTVGLQAQMTPALAIVFDATLERWSRFANPASRIDVELDAGEFNDLFELPDGAPLTEPHFHDVVVPRLGLEYVVRGARRDVALRGGYAYAPSPAPEQIGKENFADSDKHTFAAGVGLELRDWAAAVAGPLALDLYLSLTALEARAHHKLSPADPVGDYTSDGHVLSLGLSSRWRF